MKVINMKKQLKDFTEMKILKRNEKLYSDCCYILSSESVASNTYFITKRDIVRAHKLLDRHVRQVMKIIDYLFTPSGWMLVVVVKSENEILDFIGQSGYSSKKIKKAIKKKDIPTILSECMRYSISGIARITNRSNRRKGTLVRCNFDRYIFTDITSAENVMKKMKKEQIKLCSKRKRYRPNLAWYDVKSELRKGDIFLCSQKYGVEMEGSMSCIGRSSLGLASIKLRVLHKLIIHTYNTHSNKIYHHPPTKTPNPT